MKRTNLGRAIRAALTTHGMTQQAVSERAGIAQGAINRLMTQDRRPEVETLRKITNCWPASATNIRVLIEHLQDEIERSGHAAGCIELHDVHHSRSAPADQTLQFIREMDVHTYEHLDHLIRRIWTVLSSGRQTQPAAPTRLIAAEGRVPYSTKSRRKLPT